MAGQVQHLICQDSLRKKKKKRQMRQFFLQSVYILWTHARSVLSPSPLKCIKEKKKRKKTEMVQYTLRCIWTWLNLSKRRQTLLQRGEGMSAWRSADCRPRSQSLHSTAAQHGPEKLWHIYCSSWCTGSCLARRARLFVPKCWGVTEKYIVCCHAPVKKNNKKNQVKSPAPTSQPASQPALSEKQKN